jgi:hypothetical protein
VGCFVARRREKKNDVPDDAKREIGSFHRRSK